MTTARSFHTATLLADGRVLVTGGSPEAWSWNSPMLASAEIYDPKTGTFTRDGSMVDRAAPGTPPPLLADGRVLITGGATNAGNDSRLRGDLRPEDRHVHRDRLDGQARLYHTATLLADGRVLVAGGGGDYTNLRFLASAEIFDPKTGTFTRPARWQRRAPTTRPPCSPTAGSSSPAGSAPQAPLPNAELYDPATGTFSPAGAGG